MQGMTSAKWGYVTRRVDDPLETRLGNAPACPPGLGSFVVATVARIGAHEYLEDPRGRRVRLYPGDVVVGALGNRYATDFYEGYVPGPGDPVHLLTAGGLIGTVASAHTSKAEPTVLEVLGTLDDAAGTALTTDSVAMPLAPEARPPLGTVVVLGSAMNAGKTTATSSIVRGLNLAGVRAGAGKVTGSGSGKDHWSYVDAGAATVTDFLDCGMASTFGYPTGRLISAMSAIRNRLVAEGAEAVVLEIADGILQDETRALAAELPGFADAVILAVGDALGAVAGTRSLAEVGVSVRAVSGLVTASPLASRETAEATGLPVLNPGALSAGALELLTSVTLSDEADQLLRAHGDRLVSRSA
ncbi:MAG TPA: DUF1611 domain-containing protein [Pseudonocardia sp.]